MACLWSLCQGGVFLTIGHHQLEGKHVTLKKPYILLEKCCQGADAACLTGNPQGTSYKASCTWIKGECLLACLVIGRHPDNSVQYQPLAPWHRLPALCEKNCCSTIVPGLSYPSQRTPRRADREMQAESLGRTGRPGDWSWDGMVRAPMESPPRFPEPRRGLLTTTVCPPSITHVTWRRQGRGGDPRRARVPWRAPRPRRCRR